MSAATATCVTTTTSCMSAASGCVTATATARRGYCMSAASTRGCHCVTTTATTARGCYSATTATAASKRCATTTASTAAHVATASTAAKAMPAPAVAVAPVSPWTYAQEDAIVKIARAEVAIGRAGVGRIVVIAIRAYRRRTANPDYELCLSGWHEGQGTEQCCSTQKNFESAHLEPFLRWLRLRNFVLDIAVSGYARSGSRSRQLLLIRHRNGWKGCPETSFGAQMGCASGVRHIPFNADRSASRAPRTDRQRPAGLSRSTCPWCPAQCGGRPPDPARCHIQSRSHLVPEPRAA